MSVMINTIQNTFTTNSNLADDVSKAFMGIAHPHEGLRYLVKDVTDEMIGTHDEGLDGLLFFVVPSNSNGKREIKKTG